MNRQRLLRGMRIAWSALLGLLCLLLIVLWVRSYTLQETISTKSRARGKGGIAVSTLRGSLFINQERFYLTIDDPAEAAALGPIYHSRKPLAGGRVFISSQPDIGYEPRGKGTKLPIWLVVAAVVVVAAIPWFPWSTRFSVRTLFIVVTLVAMAVGLGLYFARQ
jgi:hypothetical protein